MARKLTEQATLEQQRRFRDPGGEGIIPMRIDVEFVTSKHVDGGEIETETEFIISVGGNYDRQLGDFDGEAEERIVVYPHVGELAALRWFKSWIDVHAGRRNDPPDFDEEEAARLEDQAVDPTEVYSAMFAGGRRGGKTWTGALICALYAVQFPGAIVWVVNPSDTKHDEVRDYMKDLLAHEWIARETMADGWELINGSIIALKSAHTGTDPDAIKEGKAHLVWMNEGQKMEKRVFTVARGATVDQSGLVLVCANPPVEAKDKQWVSDFAADAQAGRQFSAYFLFNPLDNPVINRHSLFALKREVDTRTFRIEVLGEFLPPAATVAYNWLRTPMGNERKAPVSGIPGEEYPVTLAHTDWIDVTTDFLMETEQGDGITDIPGLDFQVHPHIGGPVYRLFMPASAKRATRKNVVMWGVDEIVLEGDEEDWCRAALERGYDPRTALLIGDGTGEYQHSRRRSVDSPPPHWSGRGSFDIIRAAGFPNIVRPSHRIKRNNPHVIDRVRALTSLIDSDGKHRLFLDPDRCPKTCKSIREWPTVNGKPSRSHEAAHLGDAASYPVIRLFPRIQISDTTDEVDSVKQKLGRQPPLAEASESLGPPKPRHPRDRSRGL